MAKIYIGGLLSGSARCRQCVGRHQPDCNRREWLSPIELVLLEQNRDDFQEVYRDLDSNPSGRMAGASVSAKGLEQLHGHGVTGGTTYYYWIKNTISGVANKPEHGVGNALLGGWSGGSISGSSPQHQRRAKPPSMQPFWSPAARLTAAAAV